MTGLDVEALLEETAAEFGHAPANGSAGRLNDGPSGAHGQNGKRDLLDDRRRPRDDGHRSDSGSVRSNRRRSRSKDSNRRRDREEDDRYYRPSGGNARGRGGRSRSPNGDRYYRPNGRDRHDDRHRDRDNHHRERSRDGNRDRHRDSDRRREHDDRDRRDGRNGDARSHHRQRSKSKSPQLNEDERDRRTVFVQQLAARLRTKELKDFFSQVGPVRDGQIVKDRVSGRSKGVGYVEFMDEESVAKAIDLTGQKLLGIPIIVQLTEAEKNRQARNAESNQQNAGVPFHRLYVGNIHFSITEEDLKTVFEPFGELEFVQLQKEEQGRSRGYGFVQFIDPTAAKEALDKMNGFDLAGRPIRVGLGNDKFTNETTQTLLKTFPNGQQAQAQGSAFSGAGGRGHYAGGSNNFDRAGGGRDEKAASGASALDDTDVSGVNFKNVSRDALMRKLMRAEDGAPAAAAQQQAAGPAKPVVVAPQASRCVKLSNVFSAAEETGADWVRELEDEVRKECSASYGRVVHIAVDAETEGGDIYVKFENAEGGLRALQGLNGRWFGGRTVTCAPVVDAVYSTIFGRAAGP